MPVDDFYQEYGPIRRRRDDRGEPVERPRRNPPRRRGPRPTRRRPSPGRFLLIILLLFIAGLAALPYAVHLLYYRQALPGVSIQGLPVAGQQHDVIRGALEARYADFLRQPVTLSYDNQEWTPSLAELGISFDLDQLAEEAISAGRQGDPLTRGLELWELWRNGRDLAPRLQIDLRLLQLYLDSLTPAVERPPENAALSLAEGKLIGTPATPGAQLLIDESINDLLNALRTLSPHNVALRTRELKPTIDDAALIAAQERARILLSSPLVLSHQGRSWTWEPARIAELVHVTPVAERLEVSLEPGQLTRAVEDLAQLVDSGSAEPRLRFEGGGLRIVEEGRLGWQLQQELAIQSISRTLQLDRPISRTLALPVREILPQITAENLGNLGITELVGEGRSSFAGSAEYRITNIKAGSRRMDGVLIPPGQEFSFNTQLGAVDAENGFVQGYAVIGNRTQLEWGGGVCQDSTTVFRAAFWAGLPITERHAHPFYISWYDRFGLGPAGDGAGLDAAIFTGVNDLKFVNDTEAWLLMQTEVDEVNQVLTVRLYGTRPNRTVSIEGPLINNEVPPPPAPVYVDDPGRPRGTVYQSDVARSGRDILIYRVITANGVEVSREAFLTRFKAWPNVFVRGTG